MFHESPGATEDMAVLPGVLGCRTLRRTVQVRFGSITLRLPGGTPIFTVSRQQFMKHPGLESQIHSLIYLSGLKSAAYEVLLITSKVLNVLRLCSGP
jgi:hypothetical protein